MRARFFVAAMTSPAEPPASSAADAGGAALMAPLIEQLNELLYTEAGSEKDMDLRFGAASGDPRLQRIWSTCQQGPLRNVMLFEKGVRQIHRDPCNRRQQGTVDADLRESLSTKGVVTGVAGEPWMCYSAGDVPPLMALTFGWRSDALYVLHENNRDNPVLQPVGREGQGSVSDECIPITPQQWVM